MKFLKLALRLSLFANIVLFLFAWSQWQQRQRDAKGIELALKSAQNSTDILKQVNNGLDRLHDNMNINSLRRTALEDQLESAIEELENHVR